MSDNRPIPDTIEVPGEKWDEIVGMLKALEWVPIEKPPGWTAGDWLATSMKACPVCKVIHVPDGSSFAEPGLENGHEPDCRLAKLLGELP